MATLATARGRRTRRASEIHRPNGAIHPRVQAVGPEHFGIVSCDCAKARSKWMLADFYGNVLIDPAPLPHTKPDLEAAIGRLRTALAERRITDQIVAVERTGRYHLVVKHAFAAAGFEVRVVHPFATKQFRQPADPGNKTDDTDLAAIHRAAVNGFGLLERPLDPVHAQLRLLARHRRDLVRKNAAVRCQIRDHLNVYLPGYDACFADPFAGEVALAIARRLDSPRAIRQAGVAGLARLLRDRGVRFQAPTLERLIAWAERAPEAAEEAAVHQRIVAALDDDRLTKLQQIAALERDLAALLARTPYVLLLSIPGINVVSAAEFAGEMGPIGNYASSRSITRRAGLVPSRHQSDEVDRPDGPLLRRANRDLRQAILTIADNLITCNEHFRGLARKWRQEGKAPQQAHVKVAARFCRIAYQMVAGGRVFEHPCCRRRDYILSKLIKFQREHATPLGQAQATLASAVEQLPRAEHGAEAAPLVAELETAAGRRGRGPCPIGELLPAVLAKLGVTGVESTPSGE